MITAETYLTLALDGDDVTCMEQIGRSRAVVIQRALQLADDEAVAVEHPMLVQRIHSAVAAGKARRSASRLA
jgi:hypothetical protein